MDMLTVQKVDQKHNIFYCKINILFNFQIKSNLNLSFGTGEDELNCDLCTNDEFRCGANECIPAKWRCDNQKDCVNGEDEKNCTTITNYNQSHYHPACTDSEFKCKNDECVDWDRVCNGLIDGCSDSSDEGENCATSCKNSPCEQRCIRSPNGPTCACHDGFSLNPDKKSCSDVNECTWTNSPCAQKCENTIGSYRCSCFSRFALSTDKVSCKSTDKQMYMFYSANDMIYRLEHGSIKTIKSTNDTKIVSLDMHYEKQMLYFTIQDSGSLYEFNFTNEGAALNTVKNIGQPTHLAIDWIVDNVYFIDESVAIKVCHMEKQKCITLIKFEAFEHVKSLAIDAVHHRLFYVYVKRMEFTMPESKIISRNLDGSQMQLVTKDSFTVPSITCDFYTERIYYVGLETREIWSVKYDGTGKKLMISRNEFIVHPIEITLFESHAYVSNADSNTIVNCQMYGERQCKPFQVNVNHPDNLVIVQKSRQKSAENLCANNKCSTICTPSHIGAKCICDFGMVVGSGIECNDKVSTHIVRKTHTHTRSSTVNQRKIRFQFVVFFFSSHR